ncbi:MAG: CDGSH iron-sulfur domain-containing protein [Rickettsiales bacterium]|nr:CDGSH iron-sulfur domain-containing protein [Rickettsiales bacterium]
MNTPTKHDLNKNKNYFWCSCGYSNNNPFCDGSHRAEATEKKSLKFSIEEDKTVYLCNCKKTSNPPYCDGSHSN